MGFASSGIDLSRCTARVVGTPSQTPPSCAQNLVQRHALRQQQPAAEIAALLARRGQQQVAHAAQAGEGLRARAGLHADARHLRQAARDQARRASSGPASAPRRRRPRWRRYSSARRRAPRRPGRSNGRCESSAGAGWTGTPPPAPRPGAAMVQVAGSPATISPAKVGPESAPTRVSPHASVTIWLTRSPVVISSPLLRLSTGAPGGAKRFSVSRTCCTGSASRT